MEIKQVWWVRLTKNKYLPLIKRRISYLSDNIVTLNDPFLGLPNFEGKTYSIDTVEFIELVKGKEK